MNETVAFGAFIILCALLIVSLKRAQRSARGHRLKHGSTDAVGGGKLTGAPAERSEEIIGWRTWQLETVGSELRLRSVVVPVHWKGGEALEARNLPPPARTNYGAGIYAAKTKAGALEAMADWPSCVYGTVALWGNVIEHSRGYRAQFAYPRHLWCKDMQTARDLSRIYGCEADVEAA
jgi:hypothetical protein